MPEATAFFGKASVQPVPSVALAVTERYRPPSPAAMPPAVPDSRPAAPFDDDEDEEEMEDEEEGGAEERGNDGGDERDDRGGCGLGPGWSV